MEVLLLQFVSDSAGCAGVTATGQAPRDGDRSLLAWCWAPGASVLKGRMGPSSDAKGSVPRDGLSASISGDIWGSRPASNPAGKAGLWDGLQSENRGSAGSCHPTGATSPPQGLVPARGRTFCTYCYLSSPWEAGGCYQTLPSSAGTRGTAGHPGTRMLCLVGAGAGCGGE